VAIVPFVATAVGLLYAVLVDKARGEAFAKALIFLPMSISLVGASIIWKFVYEYRPSFRPQIGLLNQILTKLGFDTHNFLLGDPWNTLFLVVVLVWIQAGFAMVILSAAIKAIPDDIVEAARLDGVGPLQMFRFVTLPSIRPAVIVVLTTIGIATLKIFDIVRTMTGGQFNTNIVALEFYNQSFRYQNIGLGAALADASAPPAHGAFGWAELGAGLPEASLPTLRDLLWQAAGPVREGIALRDAWRTAHAAAAAGWQMRLAAALLRAARLRRRSLGAHYRDDRACAA